MVKRWRRGWGVWVAALIGAGSVASAPTPAAEAHLATWGSWDITKRNLDVLFPEATRYLKKRHTFSDAEVAGIERALGFKLYPEDRAPEFFIAVRGEGEQQELVGVAVFIDPRATPRVEGGEVIRLEVGIGVDGAGRIKRVALYDYKGSAAVSGEGWLGQLRGRTLESSFQVGAGLKAVPGEEGECQLIANAAFEALYLMKVALGRR